MSFAADNYFKVFCLHSFFFIFNLMNSIGFSSGNCWCSVMTLQPGMVRQVHYPNKGTEEIPGTLLLIHKGRRHSLRHIPRHGIIFSRSDRY
jgi:hypothetical protein